MKELVIIDGHALAYRAHFAMIRNPLINTKGFNVSAIYGFTGYLLRLLNKYPEANFAVTFDCKGATFRKDIFEEYKANRKPMPDELRAQMSYLDTIVELFGLPVYKMDGLEADDIIAHLARRGEEAGMDVKIVSKDKDLMQLVSDRVHQLTPESGAGFDEYDPKKVKEKMGVFPDRIADLLAMMGDTADNVPGLPGVGPKTAMQILEAAGSVSALLENPNRSGSPKLAAKVREHIELLRVSYELVLLKDLPEITYTIDSTKHGEIKMNEVIELFRELEFNNYLKDPFFSGAKAAIVEESPVLVGYETVTVTDETVLIDLIEKIKAAGFVSVDTETTSLEKVSAELVGISLAIHPDTGYYIPVGHREGTNFPLELALALLKPVFENESIAKIGQNLKYDYQIFKNYGIKLANISFDTMIAAYVADPTARNFSLDELANRFLNQPTIPIDQLIGKGKTQISFADVPVEKAAIYAAEDAILPLRLKALLEPQLIAKKMDGLFATIEMPLVPVLAEMEYAGIAIDTDHLKNLSVDYAKIVASALADVYEIAGEEFNLNSTQQLGKILFEKLGLPHGKKTKTGYSTDVDVLTELARDHEIARRILVYREKQKLLSTYIDAIPTKISPKTGRLHGSFNQTVAATGRLSSTEPNLQNIPVRTIDGRRIREAFVAKAGCSIIAADYSQIELRLLAHFSQDPVLVEAFHEGLDIHRQTAAKIYGVPSAGVSDEMRRAAKTINFGLMYGMGAFKLAGELNISVPEAKRFIDSYFEQFPTILAFMKGSVQNAKDHGYTETLFGRKRYLPELEASNKMIRENAERIAVNTPVQGSAADIVKVAMITLQHKIETEHLPITMMVQVHDELLFEVETDRAEEMRAIVTEIMEKACPLSVPVKVDSQIAANWSAAH